MGRSRFMAPQPPMGTGSPSAAAPASSGPIEVTKELGVQGVAAAGVKQPEELVPGGPAKKPMTVTPAGATASTSTKPGLTVSTQSKKDEIGIRTLVGDYSEGGTNHGRKYFQKVQKIPGHEGIQVFLYYWDNRDGQDFSGWWFGDQLGGSQVWARASSHGPLPPRVGWKSPWDAPSPEPGILFCDGFKASSATAAPPAAEPTPLGGLAGPSALSAWNNERSLSSELADDRLAIAALNGGDDGGEGDHDEEDDEEEEELDHQEEALRLRSARLRTAHSGWRPSLSS